MLSQLRRLTLHVMTFLSKVEAWLISPWVRPPKNCHCQCVVKQADGTDIATGETITHFYIQCNRCGHVYGDSDDPHDALLWCEALNDLD